MEEEGGRQVKTVYAVRDSYGDSLIEQFGLFSKLEDAQAFAARLPHHGVVDYELDIEHNYPPGKALYHVFITPQLKDPASYVVIEDWRGRSETLEPRVDCSVVWARFWAKDSEEAKNRFVSMLTEEHLIECVGRQAARDAEAKEIRQMTPVERVMRFSDAT
jgi:hypothetical protein